MVQRIGAREPRNSFSDLLGRVGYGGEVVIVERSGKPLAVMMPVSLYERLVAEREERFGVVDRVRRQAPAATEAKVGKDVDDGIRAVRGTPLASGA